MNAEESRVMAAVVDALDQANGAMLLYGWNKSEGARYLAFKLVADALAQVAALQREGDYGKSAEGAQSDSSISEPDGFCLVPREYSDEQLLAGIEQLHAVRNALGKYLSDETLCGVVYDGMVAARHQTPKDPT